MVDKVFGHSRPRRFALEGRVDSRPLYGVLGVNLLLSFLSYLMFNILAEHSITQEVISLGSRIVPAVTRIPELSRDPSRCAFVLSLQWILGLLYIPLLLTKYWPYSKTIRVAVKEWRKRQPPESIADSRGFKFALFFIFMIGWALGDFGVIGFPTLYNGLLLGSSDPPTLYLHMINSALCLPVLAWFSSFATVMMYWAPIYVVANWRSLT